MLRVGDHVLKTTRRSEAGISWLLPVFDLLQQHGLRAPRPLRSAHGTLIVDGWTCEPFVTGTPCDPAHVRAIWPHVSRSTRQIRQRPGFSAARALCHVPRGGDIDLTRLPAPLARAIRQAWHALPPEPSGAVHGDLTPSNLIRSGNRIAVIDWDEARMDHPAFDRVALGTGTETERHAAAAWEIACSWHIEPDHARALVKPFLAHHRRIRKPARPSC